MFLIDRMDDAGKAAWIGGMIAGFIFFWPAGLGILLFLLWTGRIRAWKQNGPGRWYNTDASQSSSGQQQAGGAWSGCGWRGRASAPPQSGNKAFDEYRTTTLKRLEEEQKEFVEYLDRLRQAKDKAEFDQFMADRRRPPAPSADQPSPT